jgi:peptide/nickel transport system ATP-binding protein
MLKNIIEVEDLRVYYKSIYGNYKAVDGVSFNVHPNEIFGIAGESGCGKSTLVEGMLKLGVGYVPSGRVIFEEKANLLDLTDEELRKIRWSKISYVPQGSMNSLNPVIKVKEQMTDVIDDHMNLHKKEKEQMLSSALDGVGLPFDTAEMFAHELSGGMKQRCLIATATLLNPSLLVADEPTTALDVVVQKGILQLLRDLMELRRMTILMVSHDIAAHAEVADRMIIMYAGKIVEEGKVDDIFHDPLHPYTQALIASVPSIVKTNVKNIPGLAPSPLNWPSGCRFHARCPKAKEGCLKKEPTLTQVCPDRRVACYEFGDHY